MMEVRASAAPKVAVLGRVIGTATQRVRHEVEGRAGGVTSYLAVTNQYGVRYPPFTVCARSVPTAATRLTERTVHACHRARHPDGGAGLRGSVDTLPGSSQVSRRQAQRQASGTVL